MSESIETEPIMEESKLNSHLKCTRTQEDLVSEANVSDQDLSKEITELVAPGPLQSEKSAGTEEIPSTTVINPEPCADPHSDKHASGVSDLVSTVENTASEFESRSPKQGNNMTIPSITDETMIALEDAQVIPEKANSSKQSEDPIVTTAFLSNSGLALLASQYDSDASGEASDSQDSPQNLNEIPTMIASYRSEVIEVNSESDTTDSDVEFVSQISEPQRLVDVDLLDDEDDTGNKSHGPLRVKGELLLEDLPPIQDLKITVPEHECVEHGKIHSIIDQLVLVSSIPGTAALNLDTVLFLDKGQKVLGEVFDVLGQIASPLYCVRFNSNKQIKERGIEIGQTVYIAPRSEHTQFVILPDMLQIRGSDASWENDVEPSDKHLDYSDDEEERNARRSNRNRDRTSDETDPVKKQCLESQLPHQQQQTQEHRSHYQQRQWYPRLPRYRDGNYVQNFHPRQQQPPPQFPQPNYGAVDGSWHRNFSQPQRYYRPPYQRMPFVAPEAMQQALFPPPPPPQ